MVVIGAFCEYVSRLLSSLSMRAFENVVECVNTISLIYNHHFSKSSEQLKNYQENERKIIFGIVGCEENSLPYQTGELKWRPQGFKEQKVGTIKLLLSLGEVYSTFYCQILTVIHNSIGKIL